METISAEVVSTLQYLLPGFVLAWVFYGLTAYYRKSQFERVVQALIFCVFVQAAVVAFKYFALLICSKGCICVGVWDNDAQNLVSVLCALGLGVVFSWAANHDKIHAFLRGLNVTHQKSHPTEWFGVFCEGSDARENYIVLHLKEERRLFGYAAEWPNRSDGGHFVLLYSAWIVGGQYKFLRCKKFIVPAKEVIFVEWLGNYEESSGDAKRADTPTADCS